MTSAYRSVLYYRKRGYTAAVTEIRHGKFRNDLFGVADFCALPPLAQTMAEQSLRCNVLGQSFLDTKANRASHAWINRKHPAVERWIMAGGKFVIHRHKKLKGRWHIIEEVL